MPTHHPPPGSPVDALSDGLVVLSGGEVVEVNAAARTVFGVRVGEPVPDVVADAWRAHRLTAGEGPAARPGSVDVLTELRGRQVVLSVTAQVLADDRVALVLRDVTDEREQMDALSAFAGVVAHDVRGPIAAMVGWSETALDVLLSGDDVDPVEVAALVSRLHHGAQRLDRMVTNLLLHATARDRSLELTPVDLGAVAEEVADARDVRRFVEVRDLPKVSGDAALLQHLVDNLVGNAVKFVPAGTEPRVVVDGRLEGPQVVEVTVTDNGIGIPEGMRRQVFQRFERVPGTGLGGTGMGLSICRTIVTRHGGDIRVDDGPGGVGSRFVLHLPAA
jgi:signal transduction histidine kinase